MLATPVAAVWFRESSVEDLSRVTVRPRPLRSLSGPYAIDRPGAASPEVSQAVNDLLLAASTDSLSTCDLCGESAEGRLSFGVTRCPAHQ